MLVGIVFWYVVCQSYLYVMRMMLNISLYSNMHRGLLQRHHWWHHHPILQCHERKCLHIHSHIHYSYHTHRHIYQRCLQYLYRYYNDNHLFVLRALNRSRVNITNPTVNSWWTHRTTILDRETSFEFNATKENLSPLRYSPFSSI